MHNYNIRYELVLFCFVHDSHQVVYKKVLRKTLRHIVLVANIAIVVLFTVVVFMSSVIFKTKPEKPINLISLPATNTPVVYVSTPSKPPVLNDNNFNEAYDYAPVPQAKGTVRVPVFTYHHIAPFPSKGIKDYHVTPEMFERQLEYLKQKNYKTLTMEEFWQLLKSGKNPTQKSVLITFDDGPKDNYIYAFPILKKYDFVATFFIPSSQSGITARQLREMHEAGMSIESHSKTHKDMVKLTGDDATLTAEVVSSRYALKSMSGDMVIAFAYPGCVGNSSTFKKVAAAGYSLAFTCGKSIDHRYSGRYVIQRTHIYSNFENFKQKLSGICNYTAVYE